MLLTRCINKGSQGNEAEKQGGSSQGFIAAKGQETKGERRQSGLAEEDVTGEV